MLSRKTPRREKSNLSSGSDSSERNKDPVKVYCRLRNLKEEYDASCIKLISPAVLALSCPTDSKVLRQDAHYEFKHIFTSYASQKEVFEHVGKPLLVDLLQGKNALLFTYGVTGSGKTYTISGDPYNPGIMPRCIDTLFNTINDFQAPKFVIKSDRMNGFEIQSEADADEDRRQDNRNSRLAARKRKVDDKVFYTNDGTKILGINETNLYAIFISYIEIYNNTVYDLLDESTGKTLQSKILREDSSKNMYVNGVIEIEVKSSKEAFELFNLGQKRKRMGHTILNAESSRSHSIFNIRVVQLIQEAHNSRGDRVIPDSNMIKISQLALVDLAGSERTNRTQNKGMRLKEASSINNSLMTLRTCMEILRDNQMNNANRLIPYRDSRLTLLFKNYFDGEGRVQMVVCVNPAVQDYDENIQVLKFADIAKDVKISAPESRYTPYRRAGKVPTKTPSGIQTPAIARIKTTAPLVLGPTLPRFKWNLENMEAFSANLAKLTENLNSRKMKFAAYDQELSHKEHRFRKRLIDFTNSHAINLVDTKSTQAQLRKERKKTQNMEVKVLEMEKFCGTLEHQNTELNEIIEELKTNLNEKDVKLNQNVMARQKDKQKMALREEKMHQEVDEKLRKQRQHLKAAIQEKEMKLKKVRAALEANLSDDEDVEMAEPEPIDQAVQISSRSRTTAPATPATQQHQHRGIVVSNRRRSRSAGDVWLEHNSVKPVPLGTVMQPSMKKRKSVSKLSKASDITNSKQSKYCLIAQEADTDGEVETKVYKGDIVPTCGGGAQVIFNDVERLRQESPISSPHK